MAKKFFRIILIASIILGIINFKLITYGVTQLKGQLKIVFNSVSVDKVIAEPSTPDSVRSKLLLIKEIRGFGIEKLGLSNTKNYTTFYDQKNKPLMWVVTGSEQFSMKEYQWEFPFLGKVPYKGFFEKEAAQAEADNLKKLGYDTDIGTVGGWSTLGFFTDPVLSNMLKRSDGKLAELILHEMAHATIFFSGSTDFNENIATFIGERGAEEFLKSKPGYDTTQLLAYQIFLHDEVIYGNYMVSCCKKLDSLYSNIGGGKNTYEKNLMKYRFIAGLLSGINELPLKNKKKYEWGFRNEKLPDNTFFLSYKRYRSNLWQFQKEYETTDKGSLNSFIKRYRN